MKQPEKQIQNHVLAWLKSKQIFSFFIKTTGTYDAKLGRFRTPSPWYRKGVSDILGIYKGKFLAIEVKTPKGKLTLEQKVFLKDVVEQGGFAFVVRSVDELERNMKALDEGLAFKLKGDPA